MYRLILFIINFFKVRRCNYINKTEHLPEPLGEEKEKELLIQYKEGSMKARNELIEHNMRLVVYIAKKFESPKASMDDLISIGSMGLIKSVETYQMDKNIKLATYASRCIENEILMFLRKVSKMKVEVSLDETLNVDSDGNELLLADILSSNDDSFYNDAINNERIKAMYKAISRLNHREKEIISLRFGLFDIEALTQKEVADFLNISQSYISRLEKRIIGKLRQAMDAILEVKK